MPPKGKKGQNEKAKAGEEERDEPLQAVVRAPPRALYFHATLVDG
jgi:translation initiation factor eIF-2B subunit epsilon